MEKKEKTQTRVDKTATKSTTEKKTTTKVPKPEPTKEAATFKFTKGDLEQLLRIKTSKRIKLPQSIDFSLENEVLDIKITKGITHNMQKDPAAFEGWAICLKAWFENEINAVNICWEAPKELDAKEKRHYERFRYRVYMFCKYYTWAHPKSDSSLEDLNEGRKKWVLSVPTKEVKENETNPEAKLERKFKKLHESEYGTMGRQLPVGLFDQKVSKKTTVTPASGSCIDLWAIKGDTLTVFELKSEKNNKVGVVSELMFYVNVMVDLLIEKQIHYTTEAQKIKHREFEHLYKAYKDDSIKKIEGCFLSDTQHPLINKDVLTFLNDSAFLSEHGVSFRFKSL